MAANSKNPVLTTWQVQSHSNPSKSYKVSLHIDGSFGCACPSWCFQKGGTRNECKHITEVKAGNVLAAAYQIARTAQVEIAQAVQ